MQKDGMMSGSYIKGQGGYVPPTFCICIKK